MGILYLVATPIGNLDDISSRAIKTLDDAALIAAEDTRHSRKLLRHYSIDTPIISYHEHNKLSRVDQVLTALIQGDVALISDAGTPGLNDPGYELVRAAIEAGYEVSPIPGPSAPIAALVASGLPTDSYLYLGYLPRKTGERQGRLASVSDLPFTLVFLETPHRLEAALKDILDVLGDRSIAVARELTKLHEEIFRGGVADALAHFTKTGPRGEITLVIAGQPLSIERWPEDQMKSAIQAYQKEEFPPSQIAAQLATQSGWPRREIYRLLIKET